MKRPGGFPRINRPAPVPTAGVEAKPVDAAAQQAPRTGFPRLPTRPVMPAPAAVKYDAPHSTTRTAAEPEESFPERDEDVGTPRYSTGMDEMPLDDDLDAPEITVPLQPPPRPAPTIMHPTLASRLAPPPVRQPGSGLLAKNVGAPAHATPSFLPPPKECSPALPPPAPRPAGGFPRTQGKAPPPPPPPARPVFQPQAPKVEAKPAAPPPMRQAGGGLLARNVGAPARARPSFLPPPRERSPALLQASPRAVEDQGPAFEMVDGVMTHVRPAPASVRPPARQHAPDNSNFFTAFEARHAYPGGFPRATAAPAANAEAKHPAAILPPLPERPRVSMNDTPKFDKDGRPLGPKVALKRHVAPQSLSPDDIPFD